MHYYRILDTSDLSKIEKLVLHRNSPTNVPEFGSEQCSESKISCFDSLSQQLDDENTIFDLAVNVLDDYADFSNHEDFNPETTRSQSDDILTNMFEEPANNDAEHESMNELMDEYFEDDDAMSLGDVWEASSLCEDFESTFSSSIHDTVFGLEMGAQEENLKKKNEDGLYCMDFFGNDFPSPRASGSSVQISGHCFSETEDDNVYGKMRFVPHIII